MARDLSELRSGSSNEDDLYGGDISQAQAARIAEQILREDTPPSDIVMPSAGGRSGVPRGYANPRRWD